MRNATSYQLVAQRTNSRTFFVNSQMHAAAAITADDAAAWWCVCRSEECHSLEAFERTLFKCEKETI